MFLESLDHLRRQGHLGPLWRALEARVSNAFCASEANKGWAWQIPFSSSEETTSLLFDSWTFNLKNPATTLEATKAMMP